MSPMAHFVKWELLRSAPPCQLRAGQSFVIPHSRRGFRGSPRIGKPRCVEGMRSPFSPRELRALALSKGSTFGLKTLWPLTFGANRTGGGYWTHHVLSTRPLPRRTLAIGHVAAALPSGYSSRTTAPGAAPTKSAPAFMFRGIGLPTAAYVPGVPITSC